jgi:UDP-2,4-diacetamido-2,4,6-trideoxy-beta-L-altropyranose hydrolase
MENKFENYSLRTASKADEELLLYWANDPETRKSSFNSNIIKESDHKIWFRDKLENPNVCMWIFEHKHVPLGLVRIEKNNGDAILNYQIAPEKRRKGLSSKMLKLTINELRVHCGKIKILAYTRFENIGSQKSLEKVGFYLDKSISDRVCYVYNYQS